MLALLVALGGLALGLTLTYHGVDETREPFHDAADLTAVWVLSVVAFVGAALLGLGAIQWYGQSAQTLRIAGFCALLPAALGVVTFAFVLAPLVLLALPSLPTRERAT